MNHPTIEPWVEMRCSVYIPRTYQTSCGIDEGAINYMVTTASSIVQQYNLYIQNSSYGLQLFQYSSYQHSKYHKTRNTKFMRKMVQCIFIVHLFSRVYAFLNSHTHVILHELFTILQQTTRTARSSAFTWLVGMGGGGDGMLGLAMRNLVVLYQV